MSCSSPGNCGAAGFYSTSSTEQGFVVSETNGTWGKAEEIPGIAALDRGHDSEVSALSCGSAGNCTAVGTYTSRFGIGVAFLADEKNGVWGKAEEVPGTAALNKGEDAATDSVSCASAGNCSAGGSYSDGSFAEQAFVVSETNGTWGTAQEVPGTGALNVGGAAEVDSMSCASAGNCSATGIYGNVPKAPRQQVFVVSETNGTWGTAQKVPGATRLDKGRDAGFAALSCASVGNCSAGGFYSTSHGQQAFVVDETNGTWGTAQEVPGIAALNKGNQAIINSVSCPSAGICSAGGLYEVTATTSQAFVVTEKNGTWGKAEQVPGTAALNKGGAASINSVSCGAAGNCSAGGSYRDTASAFQAFVVDETNGTWGKAEAVPGTAALNKGGIAGTGSVSCASAGHCSAGGWYTTGPGQQGFVAGRTSPGSGQPPVGRTALIPHPSGPPPFRFSAPGCSPASCRSHCSLALAIRGGTPSRRSCSPAAAISSIRRTACRTLPCSSRSTVAAEALASSCAMLSRSHSSHPAARAARSASMTAAARPL